MTERITPKRTRWSRDVFDRAQAIYNERPTPMPAQLADRLSMEQDDLGTTPQESTLREWIAKGWVTLDAEDAPWSLENSTVDDASLILDVVRVLIEESASSGFSRRPSKAVATWIARIRRAYPDLLDHHLTFYLAMTARRGEESLEKVETFLAFTPWRDDGAALARAIEGHVVSFDVAFTFGFEQQVATQQGRFNRERKEQGR